MKIVIYTNTFPIKREDYTASFIRDFAIELANRKNSIHVFSPDRPGEKETNNVFATTWIPWPVSKFKFHKFHQLNFFNPTNLIYIAILLLNGCRESFKIISREKPEVILTTWALPWGIVALLIKKVFGTPYAVWVLGRDVLVLGKVFFIKEVVRTILKNADIIFADGLLLKEETEKLSGMKVEFLATTRHLTHESVKIEIDETKTNFLFMGRLSREKGADIILEAAAYLKNIRKDFAVYIIGTGLQYSLLKAMFKKYNLENFVFIMGEISMSMGTEYLKKCDCMLIPSRHDSLPVSLSDATKMNLPLIVTDKGDLKKLVVNYNAGIWIQNADRLELAGAMLKFLEMSDDEREELKSGSRKLNELFDMGKIADKFEDEMLFKVII